MLWLLITTGKCNLKCIYCGGSFNKEIVPWDVKYNIKDLKELIESDPEPTVIFYGGEPLLNPKFIIEVMENIKAKRWGIQTNGLLVNLLPQKYWKKFDIALLSIDGREEITDKYRGKGVYRAVVKNARLLKEYGIELIARMTISKESDIYEEVTHILSLNIFDKIHWQLNVDWTEKWDIIRWAENSYLPGIKKLLRLFINELHKGKVLKIIPFIGIISAYFLEGYDGPPCGAGYRSVTITPDGRVLACPIAVYEKWAELGKLKDFNFKLYNKRKIEFDECKSCEYKKYCGGRCLYMMKEKNWGVQGFMEIDYVTKKFISEVLSIIPYIINLIKTNKININDIKYDPILDSTEVIP